MRVHSPRPALAAFLLATLLSVVAVGSAQAAPPTVVLGTKNFSEEYILGQPYTQALEANGFKVSYK
jgi:glycine betaine/choline ABC-type transport system substrate-binding protein